MATIRRVEFEDIVRSISKRPPDGTIYIFRIMGGTGIIVYGFEHVPNNTPIVTLGDISYHEGPDDAGDLYIKSHHSLLYVAELLKMFTGIDIEMS